MNSIPSDLSIEPGTMPPWAQAMNAVAVDRYLLGPELGRGGMGCVHAAWDPVLKRVVALKLLLGHDPDLHLRLLREARIQAKLDHPGICRIHDLGHAEGHPYIAMQLVPGRSLAELRPELDFRAMAAVMADVAEAIHAAHQAGLIHRDLKPANILVEARADGTLRPCVVDFGLARDLTALDQTLSWAVMGTPAFMSPEQTQGEALGPATDIYSLGATLYALITGQPPYEGSTLAGLITNQSDSGVRAVRRLNPTVPRDLETITLKCLEREPGRRYGTARALAEDLRRFLGGEPILAQPVGPLGRLWRWSKRRPALAATAGTGLLATALLLAWNGHIRATSNRRERAAQRFALEIRDAEHLLRIERMMPIHDIRPAETRLRARMASIQQEMARLGKSAHGPGHYALGRGHLALREFDQASQELTQAWESGYQTPEVAYGLGLAQLEVFQRQQVLDLQRGLAFAEAGASVRGKLDAALRWMALAKGATVDHPEVGEALAAQAQNRFSEADRLYARAIEKAPWLYEALQGRAANELAWHSHPKDQGGTDDLSTLGGRADAYLAAAMALAPSDDALRVERSHLALSYAISSSSHARRDPAPVARAVGHLREALAIRPDSRQVLHSLAGTALQSGFLQLSSGGDPAPLMRQEAQRLAVWGRREDWEQESDWRIAAGTLHHLWWVAAEADQRFGRDPFPALREARRWRQGLAPDIHHAFPLLIEAEARVARGGDPSPCDREVLELLPKLPSSGMGEANPFLHSTRGQVFYELGRRQWEAGRPAGAHLEQALVALQKGVALDARFAYTFYHLPRVHALLARMALAAGRDPWPHVKAAVATGRQGQGINPGNAQLHLAAADAFLAEGQVKLSEGVDAGVSWVDCRAALSLGERANPKDYRLKLLRAELEFAQAKGRDEAHLEAAQVACRAGLALKGDEPRFSRLLTRLGVTTPGARGQKQGRGQESTFYQ